MDVQFKTKTEIVHAKLHQDIVAGKLRPGQRIIISDLAKEFGVSEIPVREAIRSLESAGLIHFTPHVGAVVNTIDENEFLEIYLIRIELEALATRLAVPHIGDSILTRLNRCIRKAQTAVRSNKHEQLGPLNREFHMLIYQASPYHLMFRMIDDLWNRFELMQSVFDYVPARAAPSWIEHQKILEAIQNRNASLAGRLVKGQKLRTMKALKNFFKKKKRRQS